MSSAAHFERLCALFHESTLSWQWQLSILLHLEQLFCWSNRVRSSSVLLCHKLLWSIFTKYNLLCFLAHPNHPTGKDFITIIPSQRTSNPNFLSTVSFRKSDGLDSQTQVRLAVYDVRERVTNTTTQLGQATVSSSLDTLILCCILGSYNVFMVQ